MLKSHPSSALTAAWLVAVLGALAILIGPITPWVLLVEAIGAVTCLGASTVLAVVYFRH